jgi:hypothetical protein
MAKATDGLRKHAGSCHCGAVTCGITCFSRGYLEQLGGDYVALNLNAFDDVDPADVKVGYWDGRHNNWEAGMRDSPWPIAP